MFKTLYSRYGNVKSGKFVSGAGDEDAAEFEALNDIEKVLNKIGISMRDTSAEFRNFDDVLAEIETGFRPTEKITDDGAIKMLCGFNEKSEVSKYRTLFGSRCNIKLLNAKGKEKTTGYMATGDVYALYDSKGNIVDKLIVIVNGDVNGDGKVNAADYIAQRRHILGIIRLDTPYFTAADVNGNGKVQANDYIKLRRFLLGFINTLD